MPKSSRTTSTGVGRGALALGGLILPVLAAGCTGPERGTGDVATRHVVVISLDTTRADHLGFYGNTTVATPNLDAFAAESIVFDDFMTVVNTTLASHTSLFTGTYAHTHGVPRNGFVVPDDNEMLTEILAAHGFTTAGFVGAFPLSARYGFAQGFDHYDERFDVERGGEFLSAERTGDRVTAAVVDWLDAEGVPDRLFLFAHYFDPHVPYRAPAPYDTMYDSRGRRGLPPMSTIQPTCRDSSPPESVDRAALQYASEISYLDAQLGTLFAALRERGILDDALVVITSDHGEAFNEHPQRGICFDHGWMNYRNTVRSVGLIRLPGGVSGGRRIPELAATIDILPTVLDELGIPVPVTVEGQTLDLRGPASGASGPRFCQATKPWDAVETDPRWRNRFKTRSIRDGRHVLVQVPYADYVELYDLERDPAETTNLLVRPSPEIRRLADDLGARLAAWNESASPLASCFLCEDREAIEKLRSLGYAGGAELPDYCCDE